MRLRPLSVALVAGLLSMGMPAAAQGAIVFECFPDTGPQDPGGPTELISCHVDGPNGPISNLDVAGEILSGSVNDTDGTAGPPDLTSFTDEEGEALFDYPGNATGTDHICFWLDTNQDPNDINEGDLQCTDDDNTEIFERVWGEGPEMPVLRVVSGGIPNKKARTFATSLGITDKQIDKHGLMRPDGSIMYLDPKLFQRIPTKPFDGPLPEDEDGEKVTGETLDLPRLQKLQPISKKAGRRGILIGLNQADLAPDDLVPGSQTDMQVSNGELDLLPAVQEISLPRAGRSMIVPTATFKLDTTVSFETTFDGVPLVGPGWNFRASFDPSGKVSLLRYSARKVKEGASVPILTQALAEQACAETYSEQQGPQRAAQGLPFEVNLVYYAPELELKSVTKLLPHYECKAGGFGGTGGDIEIRPFFVPALELSLPPDVDVSASNSGPVVTATATVTGGTPPYTYSWSSVLGQMPEGTVATNASVSYEVEVREETSTAFELVKLVVTDAEGLRTTAFGYTPVSAIVGGVPIHTRRIAFGASWVGQAYGEGARLPWPADNSRGFMETLEAAGVRRNYAFGERLAFETDWVDVDLRASGRDDSIADNVDIFWFTGHANGDGYVLSQGASHDDDWVVFNEVNWGDRDLEWANIAACGPLQRDTGAGNLQARWGQAFQGLHILNGYATVSGDGPNEGRTLARHLVGEGSLDPQTVRRAWSLMAIDNQGPTVVHGSMGVISTEWLTTVNDHLWGYGSVGPDIRGGDIAGYWVLRYPS